jgi:hypothetical protein
MLEPDALKGARPVLRGGGGGDPTSLPDYRKAAIGCAKDPWKTVFCVRALRARSAGLFTVALVTSGSCSANTVGLMFACGADDGLPVPAVETCAANEADPTGAVTTRVCENSEVFPAWTSVAVAERNQPTGVFTGKALEATP